MVGGMLPFFKMEGPHLGLRPIQPGTDLSLFENDALFTDVTPYQLLIGLHLYLSCTRRLDILYAARYL